MVIMMMMMIIKIMTIIINYIEEEVHYDSNVRSIGKGLIRTRSVSLTIVQAYLHKMLL